MSYEPAHLDHLLNDRKPATSALGPAQRAVVGLGFLVALLINPLFCEAQNLATNPGFETGNTSGWVPFGSPTLSVQTAQVHSGAYAALVQNRSATYNGIAQSLQSVLQTNTIYSLSAW